MPWYKTGTVKTTINSNAIIGTGTAFISNSRVGDAFRGPDGGWYEVVNIASDTAMSISPNYQGSTVAAGVYALAPMQGYVKDSADALRAASLVIGNAATDMSDQVNAAKASAADALASKNEASASAESASTSAATATTKATEAASSASTATTQAGIATTQATTATTQADRAKTEADSAAASAQRAETAASNTANKASAGANSDITSLSGITTPLSVSQGGTGGSTQGAARRGLGLGSAAVAEIVGTVSQSGGTPTGAIIESGFTSNGTYTRFADGTMICGYTGASQIAVNQAYFGSIYQSSPVQISFPIVFVGVVPRVIPIASDCLNAIAWAALQGNTSLSGCGISAFSGHPSATCLVGYTAIGRWF